MSETETEQESKNRGSTTEELEEPPTKVNANCTFNILYGNMQSIINKIDEFKATVFERKSDFLFVTESWTNDEYTNTFLDIPGYELKCRIDRSDTTGGIGGGLLVYARTGFTCYEYSSNVLQCFNQCCALKIPLSSHLDVIVVLVYRPHNVY